MFSKNRRHLIVLCFFSFIADILVSTDIFVIVCGLVTTHQTNDLAVMSAYDFDRKIAELMKLYQKLKGKK